MIYMKNKRYVLLTLIISLFIFCGRVDAAKELTCICEDTAWAGSTHYMIVQNSNGEQFFYMNMDGKPTLDDPEWDNPATNWSYTPTVNGNFDETGLYKDGVLNGCPKYAQDYKQDGSKSVTFYFSDEKHFFKDDHACVQYDTLPELDVYPTFYKSKLDEYNEIIENSEWSAKCTYYTANNDEKHLYFNEERYILINESELVYSNTINFTLKELWDFANDKNGCPYHLYEKLTTDGNTGIIYSDYYLSNMDFRIEYTLVDCVGCENFKPKDDLDTDVNINVCNDLFGDTLVKKINDVMDIVKIVVPILLIVFGIVDFTKAFFSGSADDMSKCKKVFLKRIVAAVLVFLVPIFINLILTLANNVWKDISPDACIGQND